MLKNKYSETTILILLVFIGIYIRYALNPDFEIERFFWGDSVNRAKASFINFREAYSWDTGGFWLPLPFWLNTIPLYFKDAISSIIYFQYILFVISAIAYHCLIRSIFSTSIAILSTFFIMISLINAKLTTAAMSENYYFLFMILGLLLFQHFKNNNSKRLHFIFSSFFFVCAALTRYEALIIYLIFIFFTTWKYKVGRLHILPFMLYCIGSFYYEYPRYIDTEIFYYGLFSNGDESFQVNVLAGYPTAFARLKFIFTHLFNLGSSYLLLFTIIPFISSFRQRKLPSEYHLTFLCLFSMTLFSSFNGSIALFLRYWSLIFILGTPISLQGLNTIFSLSIVKSHFKKVSFLVGLLFILINSTHTYRAMNYTHDYSHTAVSNYIISTNLSDKSFFFDDITRSFLFDVFYFYFYTEGYSIDCCNLSADYYRETQDTFNHEGEKLIKELNSKRPIEYFVLYSQSSFFKYLKKNDFRILNYQLTLEKDFQSKILLYRTQPFSTSSKKL